MPTTLTEEQKTQILRDGYGKSGDIGGQPKTRYWTPDGREIWAAPSWREFARKNAKGQLLESGIRDANLDKGWLTQKPSILKLFCPSCDLWHDTQKEIAECQKKRQASASQWQTWAEKKKKETAPTPEDGRLSALEQQVLELKELLLRVLKDNKEVT